VTARLELDDRLAAGLFRVIVVTSTLQLLADDRLDSAGKQE
jgi:hypothetical protein